MSTLTLATAIGGQEDSTARGNHAQSSKTSLSHLSDEQFQKALNAFALLGNPAVLLHGEPIVSFDDPCEEQKYEAIHRLHDERARTKILASHDLSVVYRYATKYSVLTSETYALASRVRF